MTAWASGRADGTWLLMPTGKTGSGPAMKPGKDHRPEFQFRTPQPSTGSCPANLDFLVVGKVVTERKGSNPRRSEQPHRGSHGGALLPSPFERTCCDKRKAIGCCTFQDSPLASLGLS